MAEDDWVSVELPEWIWGGSPSAFLRQSGLRYKAEGKRRFRIQTEESYLRRRPDSIEARVLIGGRYPDRLRDLASRSERAEVNIDLDRVNRRLEFLAAQGAESKQLVHLLTQAQLTLSATPTRDLPARAAEVLRAFQGVRWSDDSKEGGPFPNVGLMLLSTSERLHLRLRLPSILLRSTFDPRLRDGDASHLHGLSGSSGEGDLLFPSSHGLYEGIYMMDPYFGPLRGAASPAIWSVAASRTFGTLMVLLGTGFSGTTGDPGEPLQTILVKSPIKTYPVPSHTLTDEVAAVTWWSGALSDLFGAVGDPTLFGTSNVDYAPSAHLGLMLTIEQLFRCLSSLLVQHRDVIARRTLLLKCLDTLEGLTGHDLNSMFNVATAEKAADRVRQQVPESAGRVLLPNVDRALEALSMVQDGFVLARQLGEDRIAWGSKSATFADAAAYYLVAIRNATHGYGGNKRDASRQERDTALMIQHNGEIPDDLSFLAYLYVLDLLCSPERLRKILKNRARTY